MLATQLAALVDDAPAGTSEALDLVSGFDACLVSGLGRLSDDGAAALSALAAGVAVTPLGERAAEAAAKLAAGSVSDEQLTVLAAARSALLGAVHDGLLDRADAALGRTRAEWVAASAAVDAPRNLLEGCRTWLRELAITGWRGVDHDLVSSSSQVLEAMLRPPEVTQPRLRRLAVLIDGLVAELRAAAPIATMADLPERRWADLWSRAMLLCQVGDWPSGAPETVSGRFLLLGVDVHEHATVVQLQVHGLLETRGEGAPRLVRTSLAAAKVDTIVGPAIWALFDAHPVLLAALADRRAVEFTDVTLLASGDLLWADDRVALSDPADPFVTARLQLPGATAPAVPPLDRHPVRLGEPVLVEGYTVDGECLVLDGHRLALHLDRLPALGPLTPELVTGSTACLGLLRWDAGRWALQPLAISATVKRKPVPRHVGDWASGVTDPKVAKAVKAAGDPVAVLRERAGRLLRR